MESCSVCPFVTGLFHLVECPPVSSMLLNTTGFPLLGMYPKELKSGAQRATYMPKFIAALFPRVKIWKQPPMSIDG